MDIVVVERYNPVANHLANPMAHRSTGCMWRQMESYWWVKIVWRQIPMWRSALGSAVSLFLVSDVSGEIQPGHPGDFSARLDEIGDLTGRNLGWDLMNRLSTLCSFFSSYFVNIPPKQHGQKDSRSATQDWPNFPTFFLDPGDPGGRHGTGPIARDRRRLRRGFGVQELLLGGRQLLPQGFHLTSGGQRPRVPHGGRAERGGSKKWRKLLEKCFWMVGK